MPLVRRITNGLAWAGAALVVAIPAADIAMNQFGSRPAQVAMVEPDLSTDSQENAAGDAATLPTPVSQRPEPVVIAQEPAAPAIVSPAKPAPVVKADPVTTASAGAGTSGSTVVDDFVSSGRPLPSYISDAGTRSPDRPASVESPAVTPPEPASSATVTKTTSTPEQVAAIPGRIVGFPTPVAQRPRPTPLPREQVVVQPPLVIDDEPTLITADDLEEWESGPLSEFLARRQAGGQQAPSDYDPDGFFLDQGPNSSVTVRRFPNAYDPYYYPFD